MSENDKTFQNQGPMSVYVVNDTNCGAIMPNGDMIGLKVRKATIRYHGNPQPPPWTEGSDKDWYSVDLHNYPWKSPVDAPNGTWHYGSNLLVLVRDRSSKQVVQGKGYEFWSETANGLRFLVRIDGVEGGSTFRPGIGVYGTVENPGVWTHYWANDFEDEWGLSVSNPYFGGRARVVAEWVAFRVVFPGIKTSRLVFTVRGLWMAPPFGLLAGAESLVEDLLAWPPAEVEQDVRLDDPGAVEVVAAGSP